MNTRFIFAIILTSLSLSCFTIEAIIKEDVPILPCALNHSDKRKCELALCAIFRDEANYLVEWIEFHRLVGVSHFYLYNNFSMDNFWLVLQPYVEQGIVELFDVPFDSYSYNDGAATHNFVQVCCYNHAINLAQFSNSWLAIIDTDEFICPVKDKTIPNVLQKYFSNAGGIVAYWQIYGTSNVWDLKPGELLIEKLLYKAENNHPGNFLFKSIVRPEFAHCNDPHWTSIINGPPLILPNYQHFTHTPNFDTLPIDLIRINHYTHRTESYYYSVKKPRRARWGNILSPDEEKLLLNSYNAVYDPVMMQFVKELKARMSRNLLKTT